jgi:DNA processing protein
MQLSERDYLIALTLLPGIGPVRLQLLYEKYESYKKIWESTSEKWDFKKIHPQKEIEKLEKFKIKVLTILDKEYPDSLKVIDAPPDVLYYKGTLERVFDTILAVIGTRHMTPYGKQVVQKIVTPLAQNGITISSGFQRGVDTAAHTAALDAGGKTIAVLGTGLDVDYPTGNKTLYKRIVETDGLILSEYPLGTQPKAQNFPRRNRIVAGLSKGAVVIEATIKSGSLITARYTLDQGKDVFAVPGQIFSELSEGPNSLIKQGAQLIDSAADILYALGLDTKNTQTRTVAYAQTTQSILDTLKLGESHIDDLVQKTGLETKVLLAELTILELDGVVACTGYGKYILI